MSSGRTLTEAIAEFRPRAFPRYIQYFRNAGLDSPPAKLGLLADKSRNVLHIYAKQQGKWHFIHTYSILAASGVLGPKLREGDKQVPEGVYRVEAFNPNSAYHLSIKVNYPNESDWARAREDGREEPGSNIFIHGGEKSVGCLAMGDTAIEEIFVMCAEVGAPNIDIVIAPNEPPMTPPEDAPAWTRDLYQAINDAWNELAG